MGKSLYIAEKPSVAQEFAKALHLKTKRGDGYLEAEDSIVCGTSGHDELSGSLRYEIQTVESGDSAFFAG